MISITNKNFRIAIPWKNTNSLYELVQTFGTNDRTTKADLENNRKRMMALMRSNKYRVFFIMS